MDELTREIVADRYKAKCFEIQVLKDRLRWMRELAVKTDTELCEAELEADRLEGMWIGSRNAGHAEEEDAG